MRNKVMLALITICLLAGCQTNDPNRGKIPDPDVPKMPPSLTNEWNETEHEVVVPETSVPVQRVGLLSSGHMPRLR